MKKAVTSALRLARTGQDRLRGRLGGAEIARREWYRRRAVPLHTIRRRHRPTAGRGRTHVWRIGVKVWIFQGRVLPPSAPSREAENVMLMPKRVNSGRPSAGACGQGSARLHPGLPRLRAQGPRARLGDQPQIEAARVSLARSVNGGRQDLHPHLPGQAVRRSRERAWARARATRSSGSPWSSRDASCTRMEGVTSHSQGRLPPRRAEDRHQTKFVSRTRAL